MTTKMIDLSEDYCDRLDNALAYSASMRQAAQADFEKHYAVGDDLAQMQRLRQEEYGRLNAQQQVYLDYTGGGLYAQSQLDAHMEQLTTHVFGNPHSSNPTSLAATELVDQAREAVHRYFNADPDEYVVIFTANASASLKLLGESYPFEHDGQYLLAFDNHNSVNGIREYVQQHKAITHYVPITLPDLRIDTRALTELLSNAIPNGNNLFAFPAQSNFSGVQHDMAWIKQAQALGWDVLLDCAAFVPTNRLDLSQYHPDFVSLSFYKMFGYPTGVGALLVRRQKLHKLRRPWFAGGTVEIVSTLTPMFARASDEAAFEDGTVDYLGIPAVEIGLRHMQTVGIDRIHEHVYLLTHYLLNQMQGVSHSNGESVVMIYGPTDMIARGGTIAFNLLDSQGEMLDVRLVETLANRANISLRTGCFCNPGAGENAFQLTVDDVVACSTDISSLTYERYVAALSAHTGRNVTGAIRVSLGIASDFADVYHFLRFLHTFVDV
jgi:molybdenum cofactor sulfurtransferase